MNDNLIKTLQHTAGAENMMHFCTSHLADLIKNGRVKNRINSFSEAARVNRDSLTKYLSALGVKDFLPAVGCKFCDVKPESFSLLGALNLSLEINDALIKGYKELLGSMENKEEQAMFKAILREKVEERSVLKKEKDFVSEAGEKVNIIDARCIPEIISSLWK
jgi:hypothetical protein